MPPSSSSNIETPIQLLRSSTLKKRPDPANLLEGQPAVNTNSSEPGLFFADSTNSDLIKIGPCHVGSSAPNSSPLPSGGFAGNSVGEFWLDISDPSNHLLKVWDGSSWSPYGYVTSNTLWVDPSGDDANNGTSPVTPKQTVKAAVDNATYGTQVIVAPGTYAENNPIIAQYSNISVIGSDPSTCIIELQNDDNLFEVKGGCRIENFTFTGDPVTAKEMVSFVSSGAGIASSEPVVSNCNNLVEGSVGIHSDGSLVTGVSTIIASGVTQKGSGIVGVKASNLGQVQANSCDTVYANKTALAESGGTVLLSGCKSALGEYGIYSSGKGPLEQSGFLNAVDATNSILTVDTLSEPVRPYAGQVLSVGTLYYKVGSFSVTDPGLGYSSTPSVSVSLGSGPNATLAHGEAIIEGGQLVGIKVIAPGSGIDALDTILVTLTGGSPTLPATASVVLEPIYYTVQEATAISSNTSIVTLSENIPYSPSLGSTVNFYKASRISATSHIMEYVGCGTTSPYDGGVTIPENEVVTTGGGKAFVSSLNQSGTFSVGGQLIVDTNTGTVYGNGFTKSVLNIAMLQSLTLK